MGKARRDRSRAPDRSPSEWRRTLEHERFAGQRMGEAQGAGMQEQTTSLGLHIRRRIQGIAQDGMAQLAQMDAQLMRTAGHGFEFDARARSGFIDFQHAPASETRFAVNAIDHPQWPPGPVYDDGQVDRSPTVR